MNMAKEKEKANVLPKNESVMVNITTDSGESHDIDLSKSSDTIRGLYTRALELKQGQVRLETRLVENNILINDYVNRIVELNKAENKDEGKEK